MDWIVWRQLNDPDCGPGEWLVCDFGDTGGTWTADRAEATRLTHNEAWIMSRLVALIFHNVNESRGRYVIGFQEA